MNALHSLFCGKLFGISFPLGGACAEELAGAAYSNGEALFVLCAGFGYHGVEGWRKMVRLGVFDEAAFVVVFSGHNRLEIDMLDDMAYHKIESGLDAFVEIDGANEGFEGVGKG